MLAIAAAGAALAPFGERARIVQGGFDFRDRLVVGIDDRHEVVLTDRPVNGPEANAELRA